MTFVQAYTMIAFALYGVFCQYHYFLITPTNLLPSKLKTWDECWFIVGPPSLLGK